MASHVRLEFEKGAVLEGSSNCADYGNCKWTDGLITGDKLSNIKIIGEGILDGVDCFNPRGEGGMRGPHCIRLTNCDSIVIKDITIVRSANWAMNFRYCSNGIVENVKVRGGHDAFHTRWCNDFYVNGCDFRTGDDCFAGNDNKDFVIENCKVNSSCNGFRFGCQNLLVHNVYIWGPGEFEHISQNRNNTLSAFIHFSPKDENPKSLSCNWLLQNITIEGVDNAFNYNFKDGLWQTGMPATTMVFDSLTIRDVKKAFNVCGDKARQFNLSIRNASISERDSTNFSSMLFEGREVEVPAFLNFEEFGSVDLHNVTIHTNGSTPAISAVNGNILRLHEVHFNQAEEGNVIYSEVIEVQNQTGK